VNVTAIAAAMLLTSVAPMAVTPAGTAVADEVQRPAAAVVTTTRSSPVAQAATGRGRTVWVCRPRMRHNPCLGELDTTVIAPDGSSTQVPFRRAARPAFDCFYVYPTVSRAASTNAPRRAAPEIVFAARAQAALFQRECRLFVPAYRQITSAGLAAGAFADPAARRIAQRDVDRAFDDYLARFNHGRPFLLLGHSQGAFTLAEVVRTRIDPSPTVRARLVSAMLIGGAPWLAPGSSTTGAFADIPPCTDPDQAGCLVAYNTFGATPPPSSLFGRTVDGRTIVCTNPAGLTPGVGPLDPIVPLPDPQGGDVVRGFWQFTDSVLAQCRSTSDFTWLEVQRPADSLLPELAVAETSGPAWGLHRVDITLALGDLIGLAARQAAAVGG
jgi:hypothetical protein